jgi:sugar lactone lactonase YvrE
MLKNSLQSLVAIAVCAFVPFHARAADSPGTHAQVQLIRVVEQGGAEKLTTFAVDKQGRVLAGVAGNASVIRVYDPTGTRIGDWTLPVPPEAINVGPQGKIFVGGQGKLLRLDEAGTIEKEAAAPNMAGAKEAALGVRNRMQQQAERDLTAALQAKVRTYQKRLADVEKKIAAVDRESEAAAEEPDAEKTQKKLRAKRMTYTRMKSNLQKLIANPAGQKPGKRKPAPPKRDPEEEARQVQQLVAKQMIMISISASKKDVFVACSSTTGHGYDVWRTNHDFNDGRKMGEGLSGCCNQLDVQANDNGVYVAENNQHRVRCFSREGAELLTFGSRSRDGGEGFEGCCNPMNVNFGPNQTVYTAEAGSGRVMRFSPDGKFLEVVGAVDLVPGCKKVSIAVSPDGGRVYMLDITRGHIVVMESKGGAGRPDGKALSMR